MGDETILSLAHEALEHWGGADPKLISNRENAVFKAQTSDGVIALRVHRPGYQNDAYIEGELDWTAALADLGFACPRPVPSLSGALIAKLSSGHTVSAVKWISARPIGKHGISLRNAPQQFERIGSLIANLHNHTDTLSRDYSRPTWMVEDLLGDTPHWGKFWQNPALNKSEINLVHAACQHARDVLTHQADLDIGLIHADLMQENILEDQNGLKLIDFDDSGVGFRLYDLGTALVQHTESSAYKEIQAALWQGYSAHRKAILPSRDILPLFTMLRGMASAGWIISRAAQNDPIQRVYVDRMLRTISNCVTS
ncbi:MAG: phosphotransferase [Litoreibacter sp.]